MRVRENREIYVAKMRAQAAEASLVEYTEGECQLCGEHEDDEMGEFWIEEHGTSVVAHAQCGLDHYLEIA